MQVEHRLPRQHIPPALQGKSLNSANLYGLKQVLHAHARASEAGRKFNAYLFETRRPEANHRISREAEALSWDSDQRIELLVGVFVVKDGQGIATGGHPVNWILRMSAGTDCLNASGSALQFGKCAGFRVMHKRMAPCVLRSAVKSTSTVAAGAVAEISGIATRSVANLVIRQLLISGRRISPSG